MAIGHFGNRMVVPYYFQWLYQNVLFSKCPYCQNILLPKRPIIRMYNYQNVLLPKRPIAEMSVVQLSRAKLSFTKMSGYQ